MDHDHSNSVKTTTSPCSPSYNNYSGRGDFGSASLESAKYSSFTSFFDSEAEWPCRHWAEENYEVYSFKQAIL